MKIFISWSGELSKKIGNEFRLWLPNVVPHVEVFYSKESLDVGKQWIDGLSEALENVKYGISIITKDNLLSPWINYEAGAIFHKNDDKCTLIPLLIDINTAELTGPLSTLQAINYSEGEIRRLVNSINENLKEKKLPEAMIETIFNTHWKEFDKRIKHILEDHDINFNPDENVNKDIMLKRIYDYTRSIAINNGLTESENLSNRGYGFKSKCERYVYHFIKDNELYEEHYKQNFNSIYNFCNSKLRAAKIIHTPIYLRKTICEILNLRLDEI